MDLYPYYKDIFKATSKPLAFLDADKLAINVRELLKRSEGKQIRIASKSVRCVQVLRHLLEGEGNFIGLMSYSGAETLHLLEHGFDNILLGYPLTDAVQIDALCEAVGRGKKIYFMVDLKEHVRLIQEAAARHGVKARLCIDIDMSSRFPFLYFGVYRSAVGDLNALKALAAYIKSCPDVRLRGIMGYESQIAGLGDNVKGEGLKNALIRYLKKRSVKEVSSRRKACYDYLIGEGFDIELVNGGGTGSLETTCREDCVTEVTIGSGFYNSHLFDSYRQFKHEPALAYMLDITRNPQPGVYTCAGGGYVASGAVGLNKQPQPYLPEGVKLFANEGTGEVQTPFRYSGSMALKPGDPIIMRHSKAGELCERFNEIYVVSDGKISDKYKTYRGEGKSFM